jgi:hypothetical protein
MSLAQEGEITVIVSVGELFDGANASEDAMCAVRGELSRDDCSSAPEDATGSSARGH